MNIREVFGVDYLLQSTQQKLILKIKKLKNELKQKHDNKKLIELYALIEQLD